MLTTVHKLHLKPNRGGKTKVAAGKRKPLPEARVPHVAKLTALAIRLDEMLQSGEVANQAELARLGKVSRGRLTQIMNLLNLAPDIQEAVLFLPEFALGYAPLTEGDLRPIAGEVGWERQREMWRRVRPQV